MSKYESVSERMRMKNLGWSHDQIEESLAITFRHPTIKRLAGMVDGSPEVSEVGSALSDIIGIILGEGYKISDSTGTFCDGVLISWSLWFRSTREQSDPDNMKLDVSSHVLQAWKDAPYHTTFTVELSRIEDEITRRSRIEVGFPSELSDIDRYDAIVDTIIPGIERMMRFAAGYIDA